MLIEVFTIDVPDRNFIGELHRTSRRTGRRIVVKEYGETVYDTDDCYDLANATNKLEHWISKLMAARVAK